MEALMAFIKPFEARQMVFLVENEKSEHYHWILHIRIRLATKFQLKVILLIICTKFAQKSYFRSKMKKVKSTIEFYIFELV